MLPHPQHRQPTRLMLDEQLCNGLPFFVMSWQMQGLTKREGFHPNTRKNRLLHSQVWARHKRTSEGSTVRSSSAHRCPFRGQTRAIYFPFHNLHNSGALEWAGSCPTVKLFDLVQTLTASSMGLLSGTGSCRALLSPPRATARSPEGYLRKSNLPQRQRVRRAPRRTHAVDPSEPGESCESLPRQAFACASASR